MRRAAWWRGCAVGLSAAALVAAGTSRAEPPQTERVSVSSGGVQENAYEMDAAEMNWLSVPGRPGLSGDGRFVVFSSAATNLVASDRNGVSDVFVRDRALGRTERVSVAASGGEANGASWEPAISRDGRYAAFVSAATNLLGATGDRGGVFVRDLVRRRTVRVDVDSWGHGQHGGEGPVSISADGRYVAFTAQARVPGLGGRLPHAFVRDLRRGTTTALEFPPYRARLYQWSVAADISGDGRYVAFTSARSLVGLVAHVFVCDRARRTTVRAGDIANNTFDGWRPRVSDDGRFVAFDQHAPGAPIGVVVWDRASGKRSCEACWDGVPRDGTGGRMLDLSADGRRIAVERDSADRQMVDVIDPATGAHTTVSVSDTGQTANANSKVASGALSADGHFVSFISDAFNLVPGDSNRRPDVFVRGPL